MDASGRWPRMFRDLFRWVLTVPAVILAAAIAYLHTEWWAYRGLLRRWIEPTAFFQAALLGSILVALAAPRHRTLTILAWMPLLLPIGWKLSPHFDPLTQEPTMFPFLAGLAGGMVGVVFAVWLDRRSRARSGRGT